MTGQVVLVDDEARDRAANSLGETLVVDAGAGSGKTSVLVSRIVSLVRAGADIRSIAAVTFTEAAATQLRNRLRVELGRLAASGDGAAGAAVSDLDSAAIGTLHSFARRVLAQFPIEAGLPPVIEVLVDVASQVRAQRGWTIMRTELLNDVTMGPALEVLAALGMRVNAGRFPGASLEEIVRRMQADWDLVEDGFADRPMPAIPPIDGTGLSAAADRLRGFRAQCSNPNDRLAQRIDDLVVWAQSLLDAPDIPTAVELCPQRPSCKVGNVGGKGNWPDINAARNAVMDFGTLNPTAATADGALRQVVGYLAQRVLKAAGDRQREGQLFFHDLLVLTRNLLRSNAEVRARLHRQYLYLLLDEFQDTDPIQVELAVRIAAGHEGDAANWQECPVPEGSIFIVGDPKQSIYRFRRADITTYLQATRLLASAGGHATLSTNFRSHRDVLHWVNHVFGATMIGDEGAQPEYVALDPSPAREHLIDRARVVAVGPGIEGFDRDAEAAALAEVIGCAVQQRWQVLDSETGKPRDLRFADSCILIPSRAALDPLSAALSDAGIPFRLMARSLLYGSNEVRDLLMILAAVDDPGDQLALVSALRTPAFACGDDDLWRWRAAGGAWHLHRPCPESIPANDPVARAMDWLANLQRQSRSLAPSELVARVVADRALAALAAARSEPDVWRRYRIVADQARQWNEASYGTLREYITWARSRALDEDRTNDLELPELDVDAVTVMTTHAAKGLEFPLVALAGMTGKPGTSTVPILWTADGFEAKCGGTVTLGYEEARLHESQMLDAERLRLLYVACTRARDYLIVSLPDGANCYGSSLRQGAVGAGHSAWTSFMSGSAPQPPAPWPPAPDPREWHREQAVLEQSAALRQAIAATAIAEREVSEPTGAIPPGLLKDPVDLELPAWKKGRYGSEIGRAVHAALQSVDLATGEGLAGIAGAQALVEGVADSTDLVHTLARSALDHPLIRWAAQRPHHKETYVGTELGGQIVEGFIDLLVVDEDGDLVVIDYKTDAEPTGSAIGAYQRQLAIYGTALGQATGMAVSRRILLFCRAEGGAHELAV